MRSRRRSDRSVRSVPSAALSAVIIVVSRSRELWGAHVAPDAGLAYDLIKSPSTHVTWTQCPRSGAGRATLLAELDQIQPERPSNFSGQHAQSHATLELPNFSGRTAQEVCP